MSQFELPTDINPGISRTVVWLRSHGYETCDSGDGETHEHGCDRDYPYVVSKVDPEHLVERTRHLVLLLAHMGIRVIPIGEAFDEDGWNSVPCIQASFDPGDGTAMIDLMGVCDRMLPPTMQ